MKRLVILFLVLASTFRVQADSPTVIRIEPAHSWVRLGDTFTVTVMIDNADDLAAFQFDLLYTPTVSIVKSAAAEDFLGSTGRSVVPLDPIIDNESGRTSFGAFSYGRQPGANGTGKLASISLTAQGIGEDHLALQNVLWAQTDGTLLFVTDDDASVIVKDALVSVKAAATHKIYLPFVSR